jgi:hypothetical protein
MQIFLSHTGEDAFEADLLQLTLERWLADLNVKVWSYLRDQSTAERRVSGEILSQVRRSDAMLYLVSPATLDGGANQTIELGYAEALEKRIEVMLHRLSYDDLKAAGRKVPISVLEGSCTPATDWRKVAQSLREHLLLSAQGNALKD